LRKLDESNTQSPVILKWHVPEILFADDVATGSVTNAVLRRAVNHIQRFGRIGW
jgi:hypothetical protein